MHTVPHSAGIAGHISGCGSDHSRPGAPGHTGIAAFSPGIGGFAMQSRQHAHSRQVKLVSATPFTGVGARFTSAKRSPVRAAPAQRASPSAQPGLPKNAIWVAGFVSSVFSVNPIDGRSTKVWPSGISKLS